jgi:CRP-like cAMP-binding protein
MQILNFANWSSAKNGFSVEEQLKKQEIFSKLTEKQIRKLASLFLPRRYSKGELLIKKGDTGLGMFLIAEGRVQVFDTRDGRRVNLATLESGKSVGEMALMDTRPRSANVEALDDTECLLMTRDSFNGLTKRDPEVLWGIVPLLVERLRHADRKLAELTDPGEPAPVSSQSETTVVVEAPPAGEPATVVEVVSPSTTSVVEVLPPPAAARSSRKESAKDKDKDKDDEESEEKEENKSDESSVFASMMQFSTASFMFFSSMFLLTSQESMRFVWSKDSISKSLSKNEEVASSLTSNIEENMNAETKRLFTAFQELMSAVMGVFER